jgi:chitinase
MVGPTGTGSAAVPAPAQPTERLSWTRLGILVLVVSLVVGAGALKVRDAVAEDLPLAESWSVPYVDVTLTPTYQFQDPQANPARDVALAFVVADPDQRCQPSWGAHYTLGEAGEELELDRRVAQLRAAGGNVMISFGGQANDELAAACTDPAALKHAYAEVIDRYDVNVIDLDIEGDALTDGPSVQRRAAAIAALQEERQQAGGELDVWLTLPVATTGLTASGLDVVQSTIDGGVDLLGVNVMTMNFNEGAPAPAMLTSIQRSLEATATQLADLYGRRGTPLDEAQRWAHLGATPMIGQNDVDREVFTLDDAAGLAAFAQDKGLGRVSTWSINRDQPCGASFTDVVLHSNTCSGITQEPLAFAKVFTTLPGRPPAAPPTDAITVQDQRTRVDDPAKSPYPIWRPTAQYPEGYKVVWHGMVYQAKWYTQGADPSTVVTSTWDTPWALIGPVGPKDVAPTLTTMPPGTYPAWNPSTLYDKGARVEYTGLPYEALWATTGDAPSTLFPVGPESPWQPLFTDPGRPPT